MFSTAFSVSDKLLKDIGTHVFARSGKQLRPVLVLLAARLCNRPTTATYRVATALELLHTASLLHDDVVDNTTERRNQPSTNAIFGNQTAVLAGDYLLSLSMEQIAATQNSDLLNALVTICKQISGGELLQLQHAYSVPTEAEYYEIIRRKTAALFACCAEGGAISVEATPHQRHLLHDFGENLGICFQIKDDIFDYSNNSDIGKPLMNDIREGKITLPLLHTLQQLCASERDALIAEVRYHPSESINARIRTLIVEHHGIDYATQAMERFAGMASVALNDFPKSTMQQALFTLLNYVKTRTL